MHNINICINIKLKIFRCYFYLIALSCHTHLYVLLSRELIIIYELYLIFYTESTKNRTEHFAAAAEKTPRPVTVRLLLQVLYHTKCVHTQYVHGHEAVLFASYTHYNTTAVIYYRQKNSEIMSNFNDDQFWMCRVSFLHF